MIRSPLLAVPALLMALAAPPSQAETVSLDDGGVTLLGNLETVSPGGLADGVVLLVHGTLAHHAMELIASLQSMLAERGRNSLAVTLSLGLPSRTGMYECAQPHRHRHTDAVREIGLWMDWLAARGTGPVTLAGHSRGGNQVARYALEAPARLHALALIAPATFDVARARAAYRQRYGIDLEPALRAAREAAPEAWLEGVPFLYCGPSRVTAGAFLSYHADDGRHDTPALLPSIRVPALVVAGSADDTVGDVPARVRPHLDEDTRLMVVEGAGHFFRDLYGEDLADALDAFVTAPH